MTLGGVCDVYEPLSVHTTPKKHPGVVAEALVLWVVATSVSSESVVSLSRGFCQICLGYDGDTRGQYSVMGLI